MALEQYFSDEPWPEEGRTLGEIIERLVGPQLWPRLLHLTSDRPLPDVPPRQIFDFCAVPGQPPRQIFDFCLLPGLRYQRALFGPLCIGREVQWGARLEARIPFLDAWDSGAIIAKARVGGPLEPLTDIPPPRAGYTLTIRSLLRSVIIDPTTRFRDPSDEKRYYDVRFWPNEVRRSHKGSKRRVDAVKQSANHIAGLLRASPNRPTHSKEELRNECIGSFKATWDDFDNAWTQALKDVPQAKQAWTRPGRR